MLEIRKMDTDTTDKFIKSGEPSTAEFIGANIEDGFANTTTGVALDAIKESYASAPNERASDLQAKENINAFYDKREPKVVDSSSPQLKNYSLEDYKKSEYFREGVAFQDGWGEGRAKYLAENFDENREREEILKRGDTGFGRKAVGFASQMIGSLPDPINLIPFGGAAGTGAKIGEKVVRAGIEGAVGNIAVSAVTRPYWEDRGTDSDWTDYVNDIWIGGVLGGGMGALGHGVSTGFKKTDVTLKDKAVLAQTGDAAIDSLAKGEEFKVDLEAHNKAIDSVYDIPEVQRSRKVQDMIEELDIAGIAPDEARIQIAPLVAHAEAFAKDMNMSVDDFLREYGPSFQRSEVYDGRITPTQMGEALPVDEMGAPLFQGNEYHKKSNGKERGAITFQDDGRTIIHLFENADQSTIVHETGHLFLNNMERFSALENTMPQMRSDFASIKKWMGVVEGGKIEKVHHEKFARGFEQFLREGSSPRPELQKVFTRFKEWLTSIYKSNDQLKVKLNDNARAVYSRLLGANDRPKIEPRPEIKAPEPLFKDEAELDIKATEVEIMAQTNPGLATAEEVTTFKESITEIESEELAMDEVLQFFQSAKDDAALLASANKVGMSKTQFEKIIDEFNKKLMDEDASRLGIEKIIEERRVELAVEAKELKRQAYLALSARIQVQNHIDAIIQGGGTAQQSVLSIIEGDSSLRGVKGAGNSVDGSYMALAQSTSSRAFSELKKVDPTIEKLFESDVHFNQNVAKEMMKPGSSGDAVAKQAGEILSRYSEDLRQRANLAGAKIGKIDGHVPRSHDVEKMIGKEAEWVKFMEDNLDRDRTFGKDADQADVTASLKESFRSLITGEHTDVLEIDTAEPLRRPPRNIAKKMGESRSLHFATPEAEVSYLKAFGQGENILESMAKHYESMSRKIALMERLGPNPESTITYMVDKLRKDIDAKKVFGTLDDAKTVKMLNDLGTTGSLKSRDSTIGHAMMQALGEVDHAQGSFKNFSQIARAMNSLTKLGSALLSQPTDFVHALNERRLLSNNNEASLWVDLLSDYFKKATPEQLEVMDQLGIFVDAINYKNFNRFDGDNINNKLSRANDKMFRYSGQNWHVKHAKFAAGMSLSREMGSNIGKAWNDVHPGLKEMLVQYGSFNEAKWNMIKQAAPDMIDGKAYFHPGLLNKIDDSVFNDLLPDNLKGDAAEVKRERFKLEMDLRTFFVEESRNAAPEPDAKVRRQMNFTTKPGSRANEAIKLLTQFKTFAFVNYDRSIKGKRMMKDKNDYGGLIHHAVATVALGYISTILKDLAKGNTPADPTMGKSWGRAVMQSGGLGIMGDFFGSAYSARSGSDVISSLAGPTMSTLANTSVLALKAAHGETYEDGSKYAAKWVDVARSLAPAPFSSLWYTRAAMDHLVWQNLKETLEPGSIRRSERRLKKEFNQQSLGKSSFGF